ncbi:hypothetical protein P171DRAFT_522936 [Karstenula rhodostoma CBS 690.94]|uniref:Uncharacterized protein n=1 Tax=Karstenula rhodostoma CBS 690.94 TaxID=1392251 RepID=A0A9P4PFE8_9PLEO|nr:hypothetical protein P171DRAFT_522936 [Karstenula rhodostoma CBS 690.94]
MARSRLCTACLNIFSKSPSDIGAGGMRKQHHLDTEDFFKAVEESCYICSWTYRNMRWSRSQGYVVHVPVYSTTYTMCIDQLMLRIKIYSSKTEGELRYTADFWGFETRLADQYPNIDSLRDDWMRVVQEYSIRRLTFASDRLPALAGIINGFRNQLKDESIYGLWLKDIHRGLMFEQMRDNIGTCVVPTGNDSPTWSWAALHAPVIWDIRLYQHQICKICAIDLLRFPRTLQLRLCGKLMNFPSEYRGLDTKVINVSEFEVRGSDDKGLAIRLRPDHWFIKQNLQWEIMGEIDAPLDMLRRQSLDYLTIMPILCYISWDKKRYVVMGLLLQAQPSAERGVYRRVGIVRLWLNCEEKPTFDTVKRHVAVLQSPLADYLYQEMDGNGNYTITVLYISLSLPFLTVNFVNMTINLLRPPSKPHLHPHAPIPYTGSPLLLCLSDIRLFFALARTLPGIFTPLTQWRSGALDELYPSLPNLYCLFLHAFLLLFQSLFLLSLPFLIPLPVWVVGVYFAAVYAVTLAIAWLLNGSEDVLHSTLALPPAPAHKGECWIYLNGVSVGRHWLQSNLDLLALTFRRPITGVHNRTYGILFDLLQCILERYFLYATVDIRRSYGTIKAALLEPENEKVVLILHSQGGIEGGMILDWVLGELPRDILSKLEIYTFGSAANHFNNPQTSTSASSFPSSFASSPNIHIEHFAHTADFVARWGVLHFSSPAFPNRYAGKVFVREGSGHLMNMHYLGVLFPLREGKVDDGDGWEGVSVLEEGDREGVNGIGDEGRGKKGAGVNKFSRLWGATPPLVLILAHPNMFKYLQSLNADSILVPRTP